jgi:cytoskeletal protein CcmA (bactofilin family)
MFLQYFARHADDVGRRNPMAWGSKNDSSRQARDPIENILGRSILVRGDLSAEGAFRIDGTVEGSVTSRAAVVVGDSGVVRGDVNGTDVVVAGQIEGNVRCSGHLEILAKGKIEGDIDAQSMRIETGGVFRGTSRMGSESATPQEDSAPAAVSHGHLSPAT